MIFAVAVALAFAQPAAGGWSSGRPPECVAEMGAATGNVWERAKSPELRRYCDLVASAASKLAGNGVMAAAALAAAREANEVLPGHAAPRVLEGRALATLGKLDEALAALRDARARDRDGLDDPLSLLVWARVLSRTGHPSEAVEAYRALLPRTAALSTAERASAAVEAGLVTMAADARGLDDAVAALREALRDAQDDVLTVAVLALALALDRRGDAGEARALLGDRAPGDPRVALATSRAKEVLSLAPTEGPALVGLGLEASDVAGAREAWEQYVTGLAATPARPWEAHARAHLASLASPAARAPAGRPAPRRPR
jgi:tetratricopeptide (TPR) repeat protein